MSSPALRKLLDEAPRHLATYLERTTNLSREPKGIRRSEMFFFYAAVVGLAPRRILESGRARAQSTLVLSSLFPETEIISIEFDASSPDVAVAAERLHGRPNVTSRFGDSRRLLPEMLRSGDVVLIDGPKDFRAIKLALALLRTRKPALVFVHDLWLGSPARAFVDRHLPNVLLSDSPEWVRRYAELDSKTRAAPELTAKAPVAYGATFGCFSPLTKSDTLLLTRCNLAQWRERLHEMTRKLRGNAPRRRPKDFAAAA